MLYSTNILRGAATAFIFTFFTLLANSQNSVISGLITDSSSTNSIPGVTVQLLPSGNVTNTDAFGRFTFKNLNEGNYTLSISLLGYSRVINTIVLKNSEQKNINFILKPVSFSLKEVVANANNEAGQGISVINRIDMELRPTNSAQDLLRLVPGLFIAQHAGGGKAEQIFLRGFDIDHGTDFAVSVDGMPVNMVSHAHGQGYADFHFVMPETVDELQVFKGPFNAKFGDLATSGAGAFNTKNSISKSLIKLEYGQFNTQRIATVVDVLRGKHLFTKRQENAYIAAEYNYSDAYFESPQHFNRINIFGKYTANLSERTILSFSASTFTSKWDASGQVPERAIQRDAITRFGSIDNTEGGNTNRSNANIVITTALKNGGTIKNQAFYSHYNFNLFSNFTFFLNDSINGDQIYQRDKGRDIYGYNGTFEKAGKIGSKTLNSIIGVSTRIDQSNLALYKSIKRTVLDTFSLGDLYQQNAAIYIDETIGLTYKLSLNLSARADVFDFSYKSALSDTLSGRKQNAIISPKMNIVFDANKDVQLYLRAGSGYHSNDARSVVQNKINNSLSRAISTEFGSTFKLGKNLLVNAALWSIDLQNELVYVGDEAIVEINGATRRLGADLSLRWQLSKWLFADIDLNYNHGRFKGLPEGENFIPLAPTFTSNGGLSIKQDKGLNASLRYRYMDSRPANEANTVVALGYFLLDAVINYTRPKYQLSLSVQNILNVDWNEAQFDTESRLKNETAPVSELHFTPGTPFFLKGGLTYFF